jgi:hypothetical protein
MSWLSNIFGGDEVTISTEVDESEVLSAKQQLDRVAESQGLESTGQEGEYFCGICGWQPISSYPCSH